ncbi:MAG: hypothetical protein M4579_005573 [Chaenotheca gracillima]|nr:MAG: hypothetical protein M4579_005573 [Chaenotheca gracillima]
MEDFGDDAAVTAAFNAVESSVTPAPKPGPPPGSSAKPPTPAKVQQPKPQALPSRQAPSSILVSPRQRGNPILQNIKAVPWEWSDIPPDFVLGQTTCALFLQLKYHRLHPEYIYQRIRVLGHQYNLRVLLTMVDIENHEDPLKELSKTSLVNNLTLILCWSAKEAGHYLELFKSFENASTSSIRAPQARNYGEKLTEFVTTPRSINKTDALSLVANFGSLREAINARPEELAMLSGWGEKKVQRWVGAIQEPFRTRRATRRGVGTGQEETRDREAPKLAGAEGGRTATPPRQNIRTWEPGEEGDQELLLAAAEENAREIAAASGGQESTTPDTLPREAAEHIEKRDDTQLLVDANDEGMSGGLVAALARLREKG